MRGILFGLLFSALLSGGFRQSTSNPDPKNPTLYLQAPESFYPALIEETRRSISNYHMRKAGWGLTIKKEAANYIISISFENNMVSYAVFENSTGMLLRGGREAWAAQTGWFDIVGKAVDVASEHWDVKQRIPDMPPNPWPGASIPPGLRLKAEGAGLVATVYFYRSDARIYSPFNAGTIYCDGQAMAKLGNRRFIGLLLTPGRHTLAVDSKTNALELDLRPDHNYFIRCKSTPITATTAYLKQIIQEPGEAILDIKKLKPEENRNIVDMNSAVTKAP